jgi:hypothetical protein
MGALGQFAHQVGLYRQQETRPIIAALASLRLLAKTPAEICIWCFHRFGILRAIS